MGYQGSGEYSLRRQWALDRSLTGGRVVRSPALVPGAVDGVGEDTTVSAGQREGGKSEGDEADHCFCLLGRVESEDLGED